VPDIGVHGRQGSKGTQRTPWPRELGPRPNQSPPGPRPTISGRAASEERAGGARLIGKRKVGLSAPAARLPASRLESEGKGGPVAKGRPHQEKVVGGAEGGIGHKAAIEGPGQPGPQGGIGPRGGRSQEAGPPSGAAAVSPGPPSPHLSLTNRSRGGWGGHRRDGNEGGPTARPPWPARPAGGGINHRGRRPYRQTRRRLPAAPGAGSSQARAKAHGEDRWGLMTKTTRDPGGSGCDQGHGLVPARYDSRAPIQASMLTPEVKLNKTATRGGVLPPPLFLKINEGPTGPRRLS